MNKISVLSLTEPRTDECLTQLVNYSKRHDSLFIEASSVELINRLKKLNIPFNLIEDTADLDSLRVQEGENKADHHLTQVAQAVKCGHVLYGVCGHPVITKSRVRSISKLAADVEVNFSEPAEYSIVSFLQKMESDGLQLVPAKRLNPDTIQTSQHVAITHFSSLNSTKQAILYLSEKYAWESEAAFLIKMKKETYTLRWMSLKEAYSLLVNDKQQPDILYLPPLEIDQQVRSLSTLQHYIDEVTGPSGDVWIKEQDPHSLVKYLREETEELIEAIEHEDIENWKEELGDVLVQILYQTNLAEKEKHFTFEDVLEEVNQKIRRRHPHVFDGVIANTVEEVDALWQKIKLEEKRLKK